MYCSIASGRMLFFQDPILLEFAMKFSVRGILVLTFAVAVLLFLLATVRCDIKAPPNDNFVIYGPLESGEEVLVVHNRSDKVVANAKFIGYDVESETAIIETSRLKSFALRRSANYGLWLRHSDGTRFPCDLTPSYSINEEEGEVWGAKFGDNHKVKLGKKRSKTNGVKLSKMASNLWVSLGALHCFNGTWRETVRDLSRDYLGL